MIFLILVLIASLVMNAILFVSLVKADKVNSEWQSKAAMQHNDIKVLKRKCKAYADYVENRYSRPVGI